MINAGDTAFVLLSAALVMIMTPGLAFFYGGLVRRKNFLAIMMQSFISMGVVTVLWVAVGYSLAFSGGAGGVIGPDETLIFEVELVAIKPGSPPPPAAQPLTSDIIKVPSAEEMQKGAQIETIKASDVQKMQQASTN